MFVSWESNNNDKGSISFYITNVIKHGVTGAKKVICHLTDSITVIIKMKTELNHAVNMTTHNHQEADNLSISIIDRLVTLFRERIKGSNLQHAHFDKKNFITLLENVDINQFIEKLLVALVDAIPSKIENTILKEELKKREQDHLQITSYLQKDLDLKNKQLSILTKKIEELKIGYEEKLRLKNLELRSRENGFESYQQKMDTDFSKIKEEINELENLKVC